MSVISVAMSGVRAATARLEASAENLAHQLQRGPLPGADAAPALKPAATPAPKVYRLVRANLYSLASSAGGGVGVSFDAAVPGYVANYAPSAPEADGEGMVAAPDVRPEGERLEQLQAAIQYRSSLALAETDEDMQRTAIDMLA